ncbi:Gldg family protein [Mucilaginibacter galii]|uniref:ABC-type uncharacterized transport system domain-containing protein n=1 Tax=Mucilaginibacter galii TaxID=2005073 RepID=A0A917J8H6_9SPHI|nr:Gldg family protein [Mucilaginibacter galii]GGI51100.1 hypothetical protein GCM10011425_23120 [Mucilaginibacter galii]
MRKIFKIARLELSILFYSPVAWLVLTIFMIQCGITFLDNLQQTRTTLSLGYQTLPITGTLFSGQLGLFSAMQGYIYLYLPILTMGLMSRETSSGSIKLLLSSPVKLREIILGKYFAIIGYGLTLIAVLAIFGIIGSLFIVHPDLGLICSGLIGLYLLICTYAAIGLFMSCLTTYQVVAAISTLAVFAVMRYVGSLGQEYDFVRDLTYFLSISGRTEKMVAGLITTKDVFYYLIIIASFLSLCVLRLKTERELKPWTVKVGRYVALAAVALTLGYITSRPMLTGYLDTTDLKSLTIAKPSQEIARKLDGPLKVTTYVNMLAPNLYQVLPQSRNSDLGKLENYQRFIPGMNVKYVYYYQKPVDSNYYTFKFNPLLKGVTNVDKIADQSATTMGINGDRFMPPGELKKQIDLTDEGFLLVRKLEYQGKSTYLRFFMNESDPYASEAEMNAALKRLVTPASKVVFITGNKERGTDSPVDRDYQMVSALKTRRNALINQGFDVDTINLNIKDIPGKTDILVIGDPTIPFTPEQLAKLTAYINKGGNMLIEGEPGRQQILNPLLQQLGVRLKSGILVKTDRKLTPGLINAQLNVKAASIDSNLARMQKGSVPVVVQGAAAIEYDPSGGFKATPLLMSSAGGWNKVFAPGTIKEKTAPANAKGAVQSLTSGGGLIAASADPATAADMHAPVNVGSLDLSTADLSFKPEEGDEKGIFPVSVALSRVINGKQQRIVVSGDADFASNGEISRPRSRFNEYYLQGLFRWFSNGAFPSDVSRPPARDMDIKISRGQITGLMWLCKAVIPALITIMGAIVLFKRRRK